MIDVWIGDDFFHNGAFRQSYGYDYVLGLESSKRDHRGQLRQGQERQAPRRLRLLPRTRQLRRRREEVRLQRLLPTWKLFLDHPAYDTVWSSRAVEHSSTPSPCPRSPSAATTTRKTCTARRRNTQSWSRTTRITRTSWCSARGATATGLRPRATSATSTTASPSARSFAPASRQSSSPTTSRTIPAPDHPASISKTRPASRPARTPGSATPTFRP